MKRGNDRPRFLPPLWLVLLVTVMGIYGTGLVYDALVGHVGWGEGLVGIAVMLLAVLVLGTPLAMARYVRIRAKRARTR
ncbi:MAG: hypothetical protein ACYCVB_03700 [Bacilli bacterium]